MSYHISSISFLLNLLLHHHKTSAIIVSMYYEHFQNEKNIFLIDMTKEKQPWLSALVLSWIKKYLKQKKRVLLLLNKRGHSAWVVCQSCGHIPQCTNCDVPVAFHQSHHDMIWLCHICHRQYDMPTTCPACHKDTLHAYGLGIQKCADIIKETTGVTPLVLDNSKMNSLTKAGKTQEAIRSASLIISTWLLTTPPVGTDIDLIVHVNADQWLTIPNYRSQENNFWSLYSSFVKYSPQAFLVQTHNPEQRSIRYACHMDQAWFWSEEALFRKDHGYPPHGDLCIIVYKHEIEKRMYNTVDALYKELLFLKEKYKVDVSLYTTPPLIYKMFGKYRYHIVLQGQELRNFMDIVFTKLQLTKRGFKIDREAMSLV